MIRETYKMEQPTRTIYDTDITMLYKWSVYLKTPSRYMNYVNNEFIPITERVKTMLDKPIVQIFREVTSPEVYLADDRIETDFPLLIYSFYELPAEQLLAMFNQFFQELDINMRYENIERFQESLNVFSVTYPKYMEQTIATNDRIVFNQNELNSLTPFAHDDFVPISANIITNPKLKQLINGKIVGGVEPRAEMFQDIWEGSLVTTELPYMRYSGSMDLSKVYYMIDKKVNLNNIIPPNFYGSDTIYGTVQLSQDLKKITANTYTSFIYSASNNELTVNVPAIEPESYIRITDRLLSHTPLYIEQWKETNISGTVNIYNITYNDALLLDAILNQPVMRDYIYMDESITPYVVKGKIVIKFRDLGTHKRLKAMLSRGTLEKRTKVKTQLGEIEYEADTPYLMLKLSNIESYDILYRFMVIFTRLLKFYKERVEETTRSIYFNFLHRDFLPTKVSVELKQEVETNGILSFNLEKAAPDIFVTRYSKLCQGKYKPAIISPEYAKEWIEQTFIKNGTVYHRQVLPFPKDNPEIYIVCPNNETPFPGVKINTILTNRDKYPYIPCCYNVNQLERPNSDLYRWYFGVNNESERNVEHRIITSKILTPGRTGNLNKTIVSIIKKVPMLNDYEIFRYGVNIGPNSFIYCVATAMMDMGLQQQGEEYIITLRKNLVNFQTSLVKQELYDKSDTEITNMILDTDSYFDPSLFYRLLEEAYNINIYVFEITNTSSKLLMPRYRLFHAAVNRNRPCVLIATHPQTEPYKFPQCELIVAGIDNVIFLSHFDSTVSNTMFETMNGVSSSFTCNAVKNGITARNHLYVIDYLQVLMDLGFTLYEQYIDDYGKLRAVKASNHNITLTVAVIPSQPLNLPLFEEPTRTDPKVVIELFGKANKKNESGLWYNFHDIENAYYFYTSDTKDIDLPEGDLDPVFSTQQEISVVNRVGKLKRIMKIMLQFILWLYQLSDLSLEQFIDSYLHNGEYNGDSLKLYDFSNVVRILPSNITTLNQALDYLKRVAPGFIRSNKIFLPDQKVLNGVIYYLKMYNELTKPEERKPITTIEGLYTSASDFKQQQGVVIFINDLNLRKWLNSILLEITRRDVVKEEILIDYSSSSQPYVYRTPDNIYYIVQNVYGNELESALNIAKTWRDRQINIGYYATALTTTEPYVLYELSSSNGLALSKDERNGEIENFLQILYYNEVYAALLPLF